MTRPIKTILVSLNNHHCFDTTMAAARDIAQQYGSHIIGLYVIPTAIVYSAPYGYGGPVNFIEMNRFYRSKAAGIEDRFNDFRRKENLNAEWRLANSLGHFVSDAVIEHGRESDLIILGNDNSIHEGLQFESRIVQATGRPVLIIPNTTAINLRFKKAIIAWDGSREAARAAFDAVPLLQMSEETQVTCFNGNNERELSGDLPGSELANSLARYDIKAEVVSEKTKKSVSQALMNRAETGDLLVMGAYGHSRLREDILGGVTKAALSRMPCPIFMSN